MNVPASALGMPLFDDERARLQSPAFVATQRGTKQQPRLVSGMCPSCHSNEIIIKTTADEGTDFAGYCPQCGADIRGALLDGVARAIVAR